MEIAWLDDFLALLEHGTFRRAAEARNVTQPAFSRRIRTLEDWVGAPLFNRDTHRVELTNAGEAFRPMAEEVTRAVQLGRERAKAAAKGEAGTVRFASTHALSMTFFPDFLWRLEPTLNLDAQVSLVTHHQTGCERMMQAGEANLLLCHHHPSAPTSLRPEQFRSLDIGTDVLMPVSVPGPDGLPQFALPGSPQAPVDYLHFSTLAGMGRILAAAQAQDMPPATLTPVFQSHVATVLTALTRRGRGVAWLPRTLIESDLRTGKLVPAGDARFELPMTIRLVRHRARQSPAVEAFWDAARNLAEAPA